MCAWSELMVVVKTSYEFSIIFWFKFLRMNSVNFGKKLKKISLFKALSQYEIHEIDLRVY